MQHFGSVGDGAGEGMDSLCTQSVQKHCTYHSLVATSILYGMLFHSCIFPQLLFMQLEPTLMKTCALHITHIHSACVCVNSWNVFCHKLPCDPHYGSMHWRTTLYFYISILIPIPIYDMRAYCTCGVNFVEHTQTRTQTHITAIDRFYLFGFLFRLRTLSLVSHSLVQQMCTIICNTHTKPTSLFI